MLRTLRLSIIVMLAATALLPVASSHRARASQDGGRVALVIGNSAYQHTGVLRNPVNDAQDMAKVLTRLGFDVTTAYDANAERFASALQEFSRKLAGAQVALFYYAGHGLQFAGRNYLLPVDARLASEFSLKREAFAADDIIQPMEGADRINLVFLDSCRNNPLAEQLKRSVAAPTRAATIGRGLAPIETSGHDTLIMYSTAPGDEAEDGGGRNSPFTESLLRHIETPGVDVEVMLKRVTGDVRKATGERQRPERLARMAKEFSFNPAGTQTEPQPPLPPIQTYRVDSGVSEGILNMRAGPGQGHKLIVSIPANSSGIIISDCREPDDGRSRHHWCKARWRGHAGWLSSNGLVRE